MKASADERLPEAADGGASRSSAPAMRKSTASSIAAGRDFVPLPFRTGDLDDFRFGMDISNPDRSPLHSGPGAAPQPIVLTDAFAISAGFAATPRSVAIGTVPGIVRADLKARNPGDPSRTTVAPSTSSRGRSM